MNSSIIRYILGRVLRIEAVLMLIPCIAAAVYREKEGFSLLICAAAAFSVGWLISLKKPKSNTFSLKEGCVATALSWILLSLVGAIPFYTSHDIPSFIDALFETVSGFTTTGASILTDVEEMSRCMLLWRSLTHWIGGMGILVFLLAIIPMAGGSNINLMKAESPGPSVGKFVPRLKYTARILYMIYLALTVAQIIFLVCGRMPLFDAVTISFGTAGTGGFGIKADSIAGYSPYLQWVVTIFMIMFGVNFNAYYLVLQRHIRRAFMEEVRWYIGIIALSAAVIFICIRGTFPAGEAIRHSAFQVASIITTTGYSTVDFDLWPVLPKAILVVLMFIGACAGSTGGGIKVSRVLIAFKAIGRELKSYIHPKSVNRIKMDGKAIDQEVVSSVAVYFMTFIMLFVISFLLIAVDNKDLVTSFTAVAATINNIGPGLGMCGPAQNFGHFSILSKIVMMLDMLAGRLELFPMLVLFEPVVLKELFKVHR